MVLIDMERIEQPYLHPDTDVVDALIYRGKGLDVDTVMVEGEIILKDRRFLKMGKSEVAARLKESLARDLTDREKRSGQLSRDLLPYINRWFSEWDLESGEEHYSYNLR